MANASQILFMLGTIALAVGFAAHVGHAVLLANGRRLAVFATAPQPAWAGAVTGSFAAGRSAAAAPESAAPSPLARVAVVITLLAFAALVASLALRGYIVGRGPWGNMYEFTVAFATSVTGGYLFLQRRYAIRSIGFIPVGVALALLLYASTLPSQIENLVPALQNAPLLTIHVGMAVISYGIFATSFAAAVGYLIQGQRDRFSWLPSHKTLDEVAYRAVIIGFPIFATMIILGSWWASIAWSRYWGWDPKETSALVTWLTYAVYLHARNQRSWAGRPAALLLVVGFAMVLVTYSGSLWFSGLHSYSGLQPGS
ncbi:MAG TPA: c-type cytochrome biogenesis protein CcsB [Candidatus Limnocylindrales bacterium]|jgi:cytochrome c-type biogenesis protein CcsB|nr:c-type cytochrome biogenesis protein CcsB [Candidatus Limnocylindrales bacterium]